jgi:hypothetical protein
VISERMILMECAAWKEENEIQKQIFLNFGGKGSFFENLDAAGRIILKCIICKTMMT